MFKANATARVASVPWTKRRIKILSRGTIRTVNVCFHSVSDIYSFGSNLSILRNTSRTHERILFVDTDDASPVILTESQSRRIREACSSWTSSSFFVEIMPILRKRNFNREWADCHVYRHWLMPHLVAIDPTPTMNVLLSFFRIGI